MGPFNNAWLLRADIILNWAVKVVIFGRNACFYFQGFNQIIITKVKEKMKGEL